MYDEECVWSIQYKMFVFTVHFWKKFVAFVGFHRMKERQKWLYFLLLGPTYTLGGVYKMIIFYVGTFQILLTDFYETGLAFRSKLVLPKQICRSFVKIRRLIGRLKPICSEQIKICVNHCLYNSVYEFYFWGWQLEHAIYFRNKKMVNTINCS